MRGAGFPGAWIFAFLGAEGGETFDGQRCYPRGVACEFACETLETGFYPEAVVDVVGGEVLEEIRRQDSSRAISGMSLQARPRLSTAGAEPEGGGARDLTRGQPVRVLG